MRSSSSSVTEASGTELGLRLTVRSGLSARLLLPRMNRPNHGKTSKSWKWIRSFFGWLNTYPRDSRGTPLVSSIRRKMRTKATTFKPANTPSVPPNLMPATSRGCSHARRPANIRLMDIASDAPCYGCWLFVFVCTRKPTYGVTKDQGKALGS